MGQTTRRWCGGFVDCDTTWLYCICRPLTRWHTAIGAFSLQRQSEWIMGQTRGRRCCCFCGLWHYLVVLYLQTIDTMRRSEWIMGQTRGRRCCCYFLWTVTLPGMLCLQTIDTMRRSEWIMGQTRGRRCCCCFLWTVTLPGMLCLQTIDTMRRSEWIMGQTRGRRCCCFLWTVTLPGMLCLQTIDMELRKLEVLQATSHVKMLLSFMPDAFLGRGGESL